MSKRILVMFFLSLLVPQVSAKEIAITFDDAPRSGSTFMRGDEIAERLIKELKSRDVDGAAFFITTKNIVNDKSLNRLQRYVDAGFDLANHGHAHLSAKKVKPYKYLADFYTSHLISKDFEGLLKLHRFPYLHQADNEKDRKRIYDEINRLGYGHGYITVDNYDWYLNSILVKAHKEEREVNLDNLKRLYLDTLLDNVEFYDEIAIQSLGRSPKHVLLLHENEIAALFIGDLIDRLRAKGWKIISPKEAYTDPIANSYDPSHELTGQGRVAAIAHSKGMPKDRLKNNNEDEAYLDKKAIEYRVYKGE